MKPRCPCCTGAGQCSCGPASAEYFWYEFSGFYLAAWIRCLPEWPSHLPHLTAETRHGIIIPLPVFCYKLASCTLESEQQSGTGGDGQNGYLAAICRST